MSTSKVWGGKLWIDNRTGKYVSCAQAYNKELQKHQDILGDILIFLHQDIAFDNDAFLQRITTELVANPNQILGFAGMSSEGKVYSNLKYEKTKQYITKAHLNDKKEVLSLDECCIAMTKELYQKIYFDDIVCSHWHLYAVDFCYTARCKFGVKSYVLPEVIFHKYDGSSGLTTDGYFLFTMWKLARKFHRDVSTIYAPCYITSTRIIPCVIRIMKSLLGNALRNCKSKFL